MGWLLSSAARKARVATRHTHVTKARPGSQWRVAQRLRAAAKAAALDAKVKEVILNAGSPVQYQDSPEFEKYVQADATRMSAVVKRIGKVE